MCIAGYFLKFSFNKHTEEDQLAEDMQEDEREREAGDDE